MLYLPLLTMVPRKLFIAAGICYLVVGAFFILAAGNIITASVIRTTFSKTTASFTGLVCIIAAVMLFAAGVKTERTERKSELELKLIDDNPGKNKNPERDYKLLESTNEFGQRGKPLSLGEFKKYLHELNDPELTNYLRQTYGPVFREKALRGSETEKPIARAFYEVLTGQNLVDEQSQESNALSREEKEQIKAAFRSYNGIVTKDMRAVFDKYGFRYENGGSHYIINNSEGKRVATLSASPSDGRTGQNFAHDIIHAIESHKKKKSE